MVIASLRPILSLNESLRGASRICTVVFAAIARHWRHHLRLSLGLCFLFFFLSIEINCCTGNGSGLFSPDGRAGICDSAGAPELGLSSSRVIRMGAHAAADQSLKLVPVVNSLVAAFPTLLQIMEDWLSWVEFASCAIVLGINIVLIAACSLAFLCTCGLLCYCLDHLQNLSFNFLLI